MAKSKTTTKTKINPKKMSTWDWVWRLIVSIAIPWIVGGISALIAGDLMSMFGDFNQPPLAPPAWLFPVAWSILYTLMGIACWVVWVRVTDKQADKKAKMTFFTVYGVQLAFNFLWSILFFNFVWHWFAFIWLIALWAMILFLVIWGYKHHHAVMWLLLPYLLWTTFAGYLNLMIAILN